MEVMNDKAQPLHVRLEAAKSAALYMHPRLQVIEQTNKEANAFADCRSVADVIEEIENQLGTRAAEVLERSLGCTNEDCANTATCNLVAI
jgi:hypothetical protein